MKREESGRPLLGRAMGSNPVKSRTRAHLFIFCLVAILTLMTAVQGDHLAQDPASSNINYPAESDNSPSTMTSSSDDMTSQGLRAHDPSSDVTSRNRKTRRVTLSTSRSRVNYRDGGINCPPKCDPSMCTPRKANQLNCKGSVVKDICGCCHRCAKQESEPCGGYYHYLGHCDTGMECWRSGGRPGLALNRVHVEQQGSMLANNRRKNAVPVAPSVKDLEFDRFTEGICRKVEDLVFNDKPDIAESASSCRPKCSRNFCRENPKGFCSAANDRAERERSCRAPCQHTSCRACKVVMADPATLCGTCRRDDRSCVQRFGRCVRKQLCNDTKSSCNIKRLKLLKIEKGVALKFQCFVPDCPSTA